MKTTEERNCASFLRTQRGSLAARLPARSLYVGEWLNDKDRGKIQKCLKPSSPTALQCSTCRIKLGGEEHVNEWNKIQTMY